jgi:hypothetical protein
MTAPSELDTVLRAADAGEEVYEMAVALGQDASRDADECRLVLGTLAAAVSTRYNEGALQTFAKDVAVSYSSLREYRHVVRYYELTRARQMLADGAKWAIMRDAARHYPATPDEASAFVATAIRDNMTHDEALYALARNTGKPPKPRVLLNSYEADIVHINYERGTVTFLIGDGVQKLVDSDPEHVTLTVTEAVRVAAAAAGGGVAS